MQTNELNRIRAIEIGRNLRKRFTQYIIRVDHRPCDCRREECEGETRIEVSKEDRTDIFTLVVTAKTAFSVSNTRIGDAINSMIVTLWGE